MKNEPLRQMLEFTLETTDLPGLPVAHRGKVRDVYDLGDRLLLVTSDRISAFDVVLGTIPCKGQVLNTIAAHWFGKTASVVQNHVLSVPDPCAMVVKKLKPLQVEVVVRRHLTGSLFRDYEKGQRDLYGLGLPAGLRRDQRFDQPLLTPTTKAAVGQHDQPLSAAEVVEQGLVSAPLWKQVSEAAFSLFRCGEEEARKQGLILVDTKYEFGLEGARLLVMDEIHTPDSSRYWELDSYEKLYEQGKSQRMLDKENIRQWLLERGFDGHGPAPALTEEVRLSLAQTYLDLQERLTGTRSELPREAPQQRLLSNLRKCGILSW